MKNLLNYLLIILLTISSCKKEDDPTTTNNSNSTTVAQDKQNITNTFSPSLDALIQTIQSAF